MKQKLTGTDRLIIPRLLPEKGTLLQQVTVKEVLDIIQIKSAEFEDYGLVEDKKTGSLSWDPEKIKIEKEFDLTKVHTTLMKEGVEKKDKDGEITIQILETCQRIQKLR